MKYDAVLYFIILMRFQRI